MKKGAASFVFSAHAGHCGSAPRKEGGRSGGQRARRRGARASGGRKQQGDERERERRDDNGWREKRELKKKLRSSPHCAFDADSRSGEYRDAREGDKRAATRARPWRRRREQQEKGKRERKKKRGGNLFSISLSLSSSAPLCSPRAAPAHGARAPASPGQSGSGSGRGGGGGRRAKCRLALLPGRLRCGALLAPRAITPARPPHARCGKMPRGAPAVRLGARNASARPCRAVAARRAARGPACAADRGGAARRGRLAKETFHTFHRPVLCFLCFRPPLRSLRPGRRAGRCRPPCLGSVRRAGGPQRRQRPARGQTRAVAKGRGAVTSSLPSASVTDL